MITEAHPQGGNGAAHNADNADYADTTTAPPPSYDTVVAPSDSESTTSDTQDPIVMNINAQNQIRGTANIISVPPIDIPRLSGLIVAAVGNIPGRNANQSINFSINCGTTVIGDRNIVGQNLSEIGTIMNKLRPAALAGLQGQHANSSTATTANGTVPAGPSVPKVPNSSAHQGPTPPRTPGIHSAACLRPRTCKRKAEDEADGAPKPKREGSPSS